MAQTDPILVTIEIGAGTGGMDGAELCSVMGTGTLMSFVTGVVSITGTRTVTEVGDAV